MEDLSGKTVAVVEGFLVHKVLADNYPDINLLICKSNKDALMTVSSGKALGFIGSLLSTPFMINEYGLKNLKASAPSALQDATVAMGIRNDWPELRDIINKVLDAMPAAEKAAVINNWSSVKIDYGVRPREVLKWILIFSAISLALLLLLLSWNWTLRNQVNLRTAKLERNNKSLEAEITERERAEEQLQEYQRRLKALAFQLTITEEKERRVIAADLHDLIGHSLALARIQLAALPNASSKTETAGLIADISKILLKAIQDTKNLMFELSSPSMNEIGLAAAISEWLEEHVGSRYGLRTEFVDETDEKLRKALSHDVQAILFRNVRELLTNVIKHAKAKTVSVCLKSYDAILMVIIEDDGVGFDPQAAGIQPGGEKGGFGLFSIHERMTDLEGSFDMESEPGKGCKVILTVPLERGRDRSL
jgi:signal transduction histidine kinase